MFETWFSLFRDLSLTSLSLEHSTNKEKGGNYNMSGIYVLHDDCSTILQSI